MGLDAQIEKLIRIHDELTVRERSYEDEIRSLTPRLTDQAEKLEFLNFRGLMALDLKRRMRNCLSGEKCMRGRLKSTAR